MDRAPAPLQAASRVSSSPVYGRPSALASFDPSARSNAASGTSAAKLAPAKEYGSSFSDGFLKYLRSGELADVVVEVVSDSTHDMDATPAPAPAPAAPESLVGRASHIPSTVAAATISSIPDVGISCSTTGTNAPAPSSAPATPTAPAPTPIASLPSFSGPGASTSAPSSSSQTTAPTLISLTTISAGAVPRPQPAAATGLGEYRLHGLLLARHSAFFAAALGQSHFADSAARRIRLTLDPAAVPAWTTLIEYFYCDRVQLDDANALPLLALARQLLVPELDGYCTDYVYGRLCAANCLTHLRAAVRFALHDLHSECVTLAAQGFPLLYDSDLSGLPPASLLEILTHPLLQVHCELQVVEAVTRYLATTAVDAEAQRALCAQIRFPYLDNATITRLAVQPSALLAAVNIASGEAAADANAAAGGDADVKQAAADGSASASASGGTSASTDHLSGGFHPQEPQETAPNAAAAASEPAAADAAQITCGSAAVTDGQPASGAGGSSSRASGDAGAIGSSRRVCTEAGRAGDSTSSGESSQSQSASSCRAAEDGAAAARGKDVPSAAAAAAAAADVDVDGGPVPDGDSGLLSASGSACSSPTSSCGGAAAPDAFRPHPHSHTHTHVHARQQRCTGDLSEAQTATYNQQQQLQQQQQQVLQAAPLLPRDMTLEGALARLAAMEFLTTMPLAPQGYKGNLHDFSNHGAQASSGPGSGAGTPGLSPHHPYFHPYQQYQFRYQYGGGAAAAAGGAAAPGAGQAGAAAAAAAAAGAANGGRRALAVFHGLGGQHPALPPPQEPHAAAGGNGAARPYAHALAHGLYYTHQAGPSVGLQHNHHNHHLSMHPASVFSRGPMSTAGGGIGVMYGSSAGGGACGGGASSRAEGGQGHAGRGAPTGAGPPALMDPAAAFAAFCLPPPRLSYCCNVVHGLPGGCAWVDVALEALWEHLTPFITVQVSGCGEGSARNVVTSDPDSFFETNDSADPLPWIEVQLPHNVHVVQLHRYTFMHGHRRAGYYRARNFKTQIAVRPTIEAVRSSAAASVGGSAAGAAPAGTNAATAGAAAAAGIAAGQRQGPAPVAQGPGQAAPAPAPAAASPAPACRYFDLTTRMAEQFDVSVLAGATTVGPWRVLRLQATGAQEDGVHRLCVRGLRMYGIARVDLMQQANGFVVQPQWVLNARMDQGGSGGGAAGAGTGLAYGGGVGGTAAGASGQGTSGFGYNGGGGGGGGGSMPYWLGWHHAP